jgi:hypothetical protein
MAIHFTSSTAAGNREPVRAHSSVRVLESLEQPPFFL